MRLLRTLLLVTAFWSLLTLHVFGEDTDLYTSVDTGVKPNLLLLIDTSTSMLNDINTGNNYDPGATYPDDPRINRNYVYELKTEDWFSPLSVYRQSIGEVACEKARTALTKKGFYGPGYTNSDCDKHEKTLATGHWLNFYLAYDGLVGKMPKIEITKKVLVDFLEDVDGVRVGIMIFNPDDDEPDGGQLLSAIVDVNEPGNREKLIKDVQDIVNKLGTPLAKALYEAGLYFKGAQSYANPGVVYTSPIEYWCQKNYVIFMTDGMASADGGSLLPSKIGDQDGDGKEPGDYKHYLDDVAKYLYDGDLSPLENQQNIVTYTIGFDYMSPGFVELLTRTAMHGNGKYYTSSNAVTLKVAFASFVSEVLKKSTSFVAPIVPVSRMERTTAGDKIYLAFFKPASTGMWSGNIKKYGVAQSDSGSIKVGDLLDVSGLKALDSRGEFLTMSKSYWTTSRSDGDEVEKGGVGERLLNRTSDRKIYTYLGTHLDLTHSSNAFAEGNTSLTSFLLEVASDQRSPLIRFVHGYDAYDGNANKITDEKRSWILGSFIHSRPYLIHYPGRSVIYAGANDGMLHAFDDETGEELWAFIPPDLLRRLKELPTATPGIFVDGSPRAYVTYDASGNVTKAVLIFGLRRGGNYYYALDVTDPTVPKYLWKIFNGKGGLFKELGQTWSSPAIGKIPFGTGEKLVAIFGAGYDDGQDEELNAPPDDIGRGVYFADLETGSLVRYVSHAGGKTDMIYSIPSDVTKLDMDGDGLIDRVYVGDMNARMWRMDITKNGVTGKIIFKSNKGASEKRKIFYPPDVTFETGYEMLFFGTGDREAPKEVNPGVQEQLFGFKDKNQTEPMDRNDLVDVTSTLLASGATTENGWYVNLTKQDGEKCLSSPVVFNKVVYYTTFAPTPASEDLCFVGEGTARLYAVTHLLGNPVFNLDDTSADLTKEDRSTIIGTAIPSGVIITIVGGRAVGYVGVGGGVYTPELPSTRTFYPLYWKIVF